MIAALDYRDVVESPGGQRGPEREREKLPVDIGRITRWVLVDENRCDWQRAQASGSLASAAGGRGEGGSGEFGGSKRLRVQRIRAAFDNGLLKQVGSRGRGELREDAQSAGGLAEDGHIKWIAAEEHDVVAHPAQRQLLIHQPVITGRVGIDITVAIRIGVFRGERGMREKPESAEPVIDRDDDHSVLHHRRRIVVIAFPRDQSSSVDPHHHWPQAEIARTGREHIQEQAVLGRGFNSKRRLRLRAVVRELRCVQSLEPGSVR